MTPAHHPTSGIARALALLTMLVPFPALGFQHITGIDIEPGRAVIQLDGKAQYRWFRLSNPERLVLDLQDTRLERKRLLVPVGIGPVVRVRSAARNQRDRRVVLDLRHSLDARVTRERSARGWRIVVDFDLPEVAPPRPAQPRVVRRQTAVCPRPRRGEHFLVALDAGHGGRDRGASGPRGEAEKTIVLGITRHLHRLISQSPFMESVLTRQGDEFLELAERNRIAEVCDADLLVSIHADSLPGTPLRGASVYVHDSANNTARRLLAANGVGEGHFTPVSLGASRRAGQARLGRRSARHLASVGAARLMLSELGHIGPLVRTSVLGGRFIVLRSSVPSVLVETGYISHSEEARALTDPAYQQRIAEALYRALVRHAEFVGGRRGLERVHIVGQRTSVPNLAGRMGVAVEVLRRGMVTPGNVLSSGDVVRIPAGFDHS